MNREPDANAIRVFVHALFRYAGAGSFVSLRAFDQTDRGTPPPYIVGVPVNGAGLQEIIAAAVEAARFAANATSSLVFAPPIATFHTANRATEADLANGLVISVELDAGDTAWARARLEALLGPATAVVASGGEWVDPVTGELFPKLHLHWRLSEPTCNEAEHAELKLARRLASVLVNADPTATTSVHPLRWPGSWHLKSEPRLANIVALNEIAEVHLSEAVATLELAAEAVGSREARIAALRQNGSPVVSQGTPQAPLHLVQSALAALPNADEHWAHWIKIGLITYAATGASLDGLAAWILWSQKSAKFRPGACEERWNHFHRSPPTRISAGTLFMLARATGWKRPSDEPEPEWDDPPPDTDPDRPHDQPATPVPQIQVIASEFVANAVAGERALLAAGLSVYRRMNALVRPIDLEVAASDRRTTHAPGLLAITRPILRQMMCHAADWVKWDVRTKRLVKVAPPHEVAELILHRVGFWPFSDVASIINTPTMRSDGSILNMPGFDPVTGLILHNPPAMPDFNHQPTQTDAERSVMRLRGLLAGFPFVDEASLAVALSGFITPIVRGALERVPMHAASAPLAGTGKSYLWDLVGYTANGDAMPVIAAGRDEAETEKRLVGLVLRPLAIFSIDNVNGALEGDFLCQLITQPRIMPRRLATSDTPDVANMFSTYSTGNNIRFLGDMPRRAIVSRLDANTERPELRTFATSPHKMILSDRGRYIADCLTIPLAYLLAGSPNKLTPFAGFEEWSDLVRSALVWAGCADPVDTIASARADIPGKEHVAALLEAWPRGEGNLTSFTAAELLVAAQERDQISDLMRPDLLAALQPIARDRRGNLDAVKLGNWLRDHRDTVAGNRKLVREGTKTRPAWDVVAV